MAKYQSSKSTRKQEKPKQKKPSFDYEIKVTRVFDGKYGTLFDMDINHVMIYGCRLLETKDGVPFIGFPQKADRNDKEKWWSVAYAYLSDDQTGEILKQIGRIREQEEADEDEED